MSSNKYYRTARVYPAIISAIPIIMLSSIVIDKEFTNLFTTSKFLLVGTKVLTGVSFPLIIIYYLSQFNRFIAKELFERNYFKDELNMPTTDLMLYGNSVYSDQFKSRIRKRIKADFKLTFLTKKQEEGNLIEARKQIVEAVGLIRNKVGDGRLLLQHNIEYGFIRNLIGGSPFALIISLVNIFVFKYYYISKAGFVISIALSVFFLMYLLLSKFLTDRYGFLYAKRLYQEYLSSN